MSKSITIHEFVFKMIGCIDPAGETHLDGPRLENLEEMIELVEAIVADIHIVAGKKNSHMWSISQAGSRAARFLTSLRKELQEDEY